MGFKNKIMALLFRDIHPKVIRNTIQFVFLYDLYSAPVFFLIDLLVSYCLAIIV